MSGQKRSREYEEGDQNNNNNFHGDFTRRRFYKKPRLPPGVILTKQMLPDICTLGEKPEILDEDIELISEGIVQNFEIEEYFRTNVQKVLWAIVMEQPHKQPNVSLLLMKVNSLDPTIGKTIINHFYKEFQTLLDSTVVTELEKPHASEFTGYWNKMKLGLRFFALLTPVILEDDILNLFKNFFDLAVQLNELKSEERVPLAELIYVNTLLDIPQLFLFNSSTSSSLYAKVDEILSQVEQSFKVKELTPLDLDNEFNDGNQVYQRVNIATVAMKAVRDVLANDFSGIKELYPDYSHLLKFLENSTVQPQGFNDPLNFPPIEQLEPLVDLSNAALVGSVESLWKTPRHTFELYQTNEIGEFETVPNRSSFAGLIFQDVLVDVIQSLEFNKDTVSEQVVLIDLFFRPGFFAPKGLSITQLIELNENEPNASTFKVEDLAVETILSLIFKLPAGAEHFYMYYYTLLVSICTASAKSIAPVFGRAFRFYYSHLNVLDSELKLRFLDWFSFQMNNFNFSWKWNEWELDSKLYGHKKTFYNPKINFIKNLIKKELRLTSSSQDITDSLNEEFLQYTDSSLVSKNELKNFYTGLVSGIEIEETLFEKNGLVFLNEVFPFHEVVKNTVEYFRKRERSTDELHNVVQKLETEYGANIVNVDKFIVTLLVQSIIHAGCRSISHVSNCVTDFKEDLSEMFGVVSNVEEKDQWIMEAILRYWNSNSKTGFIVASYFLKNGLISSSKAVINFMFKEYEANQNYGLVDSSFIETLFEVLDGEKTKDDSSLFQHVFEQLSLLANDAILHLNLGPDGALPSVPTYDYFDYDDQEGTLPEISDEDLQKYDLVWKMESSVSLIKSVVRKYSAKYSALAESFESSINETTVPASQIRTQLIKYLEDVKQL